MGLSKKEEQLMRHLWKLKKAFMKDLMEEYEAPKPASTTIATLLKRMRDKGYIDYKVFGNSREYFPLVSEADYFSKHLKGWIKNFFGNSTSRFASFFTRATDLSREDLEALRKVIDEEIEKKKQQP